MRALHGILFTALVATASVAEAQRGRWQVIGFREVGFAIDRDVIPVRGSDRHRQVRLCAFGGAIRIFDLDIRYANGRNQDVRVRAIIAPGRCSRAIDLAGRTRNIREVRIVYERVRRRSNTVVRVQAR